MLSFLRGTKNKKLAAATPTSDRDIEAPNVEAQNVEAIVPAFHPAALATVADDLFGMQAARAAATDSKFRLTMPQLSVHNVLVTGNMAVNAAATGYTLASGGAEHDTSDDTGTDMNEVAAALTACNNMASASAQAVNYWSEQAEIQGLIKRFVEFLCHKDRGLIKSCHAKGKQETELLNLEGPFTAEKVMAFLYKHGEATFTLTTTNKTFVLKDNSFTSTQAIGLGVSTAITVGTVAANTVISLTPNIPGATAEQDAALKFASSTAASAPVIALTGVIVKWRTQQRRLVLNGMLLVLDSYYRTPHMLHAIPREFLEILAATGFVSVEDMNRNFDLVARLQTEATDKQHQLELAQARRDSSHSHTRARNSVTATKPTARLTNGS